MRSVILVSAAIMLAACSDSPQATAPRSMSSHGSSAAGNAVLTTQGIKVPDAKPADQVGWTKMVANLADGFVPAGGAATVTAKCPVGTTAISGGFIADNANVLAPKMIGSYLDATNGWTVGLSNTAPGSFAFTFTVFAYCVS